MCMLCVVPPGVMPDQEKLINSALNNPHGFGFAIVIPEENRIHSERTMNPDESVNRFLEMREQHMNGYAMWHARYATHGSRTVENCHPFKVGGNDARTYLAHNGILSITIPDKDDRSDTRIFAEDLLPAIGGVASLDNELVWEMLEDYTGGSKVAILTVDPAAKYQMYLLNHSAGKEDASGVWWSNDSCYLDYGWAANPRSNDTSKWLSDKLLGELFVEECPSCETMCDSEELYNSDNTCITCGYCFDCYDSYDKCMCRYASDGKYVTRTGATIGRPSTSVFTDREYALLELSAQKSAWSNKDWDY